ncbi:MAG: hypothetical protein CMF96_03905 [Candidatus Marinimicrobia bacterium]|nr:hypothetical protein [Candidatus Neomarinimicrobiota bacterium]|tara:strand:- start:1265 stop:1480 length:216 start_codon:yes stop_codon:yes gene_type:complete
MCLGTSKPVTYTPRDESQDYVAGNTFDPKDNAFDNPEPSNVDVGGDMPKKKVQDTYNQGGVEGSNTGLNIT